MPPFVPRKRSRSPDPADTPSPHKKRVVATGKPSRTEKTTLFNAIDTPQTAPRSTAENHRFSNQLGGGDGEDSASEADSDEFEDVPGTAHAAASTVGRGDDDNDGSDDDEDDNEEEVDWENAIDEDTTGHNSDPHNLDIGDVAISLNADGSYVEQLVSAATGKKGPSKRERQIRALTHTLHVQALMWHNTVRNSWINDTQVQKTLFKAIPPGMLKEIKRWKRDMGMLSAEELEKEKAEAAAANMAKARAKKQNKKQNLKGRDWSYSADHAEPGTVNLSHGDPILRLLKHLTAYWKQRFTITAPGLRKRGYMPLRKLREYMKSWERDGTAEQCGEKVNGLAGFRELARACEGSRDVGAQLFVALLRSIGLKVRLVANLQPAGFGFSKAEEASTVKILKTADEAAADTTKKPSNQQPPPKLRQALTPKQAKKSSQSVRKPARGNETEPINLDDTDSSLSDVPSDIGGAVDDASAIDLSDASLIDVTPMVKKPSSKKFDRDLSKPIYWAEVMSPVSNTWIPVDAMVMRTIASTDDLLQSFEPRGASADRSRQVICYTIAFSADGTAKDVTVRYLKKHQLPGKTKGVRMPIEKVPIYNRNGKVQKYEEYDWFHELMLYYEKPEKKRTPADDVEDAGVLKPFKPSTDKKVIENESLAWYKASAEFVLEEHLRREEALLPGSEPVKLFTAGKGDKAKSYQVYKRDDVVVCKTVESWHKDGRGLLPGEQPLKYVPIRAVTLQRKREIEDAQRETGEKPQQGLYSIDQTDWIIPPPIVDGIIPTNAYGNMDVFVPTMVPAGAIHLPLKGSAKLCRRLNINYAEACTGFEFGKQRAVPILTGVVVARQNAVLVRQAWREEQAEIRRKEDVKRTAAAMHWWRKMLMGMRIIDRMKADYAASSTKVDDYNPFVRKTTQQQQSAKHSSGAYPSTDAHAGGGGFLLTDDEDPGDDPKYPLESEDHDSTHDLLTEDGLDAEINDSRSVVRVAADRHPITPISLQGLHEKTSETATPHVSTKNVKSVKQRLGLNADSAGASKPAKLKVAQSTKKPRHKANSVGSSALSSLDNESDDTLSHGEGAYQSSASRSRNAASHKLSVNGRHHDISSMLTTSPYFSSQVAAASEDAEEISSDGSADEVITVRRTTTRTRSKK